MGYKSIVVTRGCKPSNCGKGTRPLCVAKNVFWCVQTRCHQSLSLLNSVCPSSRYIIWWQIADVFHEQIRNCEVMVKILCRASLLKVDDVRLKSLPANEKFCSVCDLGAYDDAYHMIMQCPTTQLARNRILMISKVCKMGQVNWC